ncbi:Peptide/nickel transport system substrate-binding protein [Hyphomicrobiales bacterium]|nr:Peptide/nickel transport system substrate-binding protein [Hyphomicrobiales bacterium]CAH1665024.1 Peptide/nickel transport system substrate-binding protein [Hyphomicrobiales bacterium]
MSSVSGSVSSRSSGLTRRGLLQATAGVGAALAATPLLAETQARGGTLVTVIQPEPTSLNSVVNNNYANGSVSANVYDGLLRYDESMGPQPGLAERWDVPADGKSITFHLRKGVKWHDGEEFTSEDVKFSALELWKKLHARGRITFASLDDVETPDAHTAIFRLKAPAPVILSALNAAESQVLPKHLYENTDILKNPHNNAPVGTGPFRFKEWKKGQYVLLERNPDYWEAGKPYLDRVIFRVIPDAASRAAALETGEVQYAPFTAVPLADVKRLEASAELAVETRGYAFQSHVFLLDLNLSNPVLADVRVRRAIAHAINRQGLIDTVWYGFGKPAISPVPSHLTLFHNPEVPSYDYDPAAAEKLLDEAGYPRKDNGVRFSLTHDYLPFGETYKYAGDYIRDNLKRVGIDFVLRGQDYPAWTKRVYSDWDFDTDSNTIAVMMDPEMGLPRLVISTNHVRGVPASNNSGYNNPEADRVIRAFQVEPDPVKRKALFDELQALVMRDLPILPLSEMRHVTLYNRKVHGLGTGPDAALAALSNVWIKP